MEGPTPQSTDLESIDPTARCDVAFVISALQGGGAEKVLLALLQELASYHLNIDLVVLRHHGAHKDAIPSGVRYVNLGSRLRSVPLYLQYLTRVRPTAVVSTLETMSLFALFCQRVSTHKHRLFVRVDGKLFYHRSGRAAWQKPWDLLRFRAGQWLYPEAERLICVSEGLRKQLSTALALNPAKLTTIFNPIELPQVPDSCKHRSTPNRKRLVAVGRLVVEKRFDVLLSALALLQPQFDCELILLGDGPQLESLKSQANQLGVANDVSFMGIVSDVANYIAGADVFVLSSDSEGLPTALVEALSLRASIVSTDCDFGPAEILANGSFGELVPVNQPQALSDAIARQLRNPIMLPEAELQQHLLRYQPAEVARSYMNTLGLGSDRNKIQ